MLRVLLRLQLHTGPFHQTIADDSHQERLSKMVKPYWNRFPSVEQKDRKYMYTVLTTRMVRKIARAPMRDDDSDKVLLHRVSLCCTKPGENFPPRMRWDTPTG